MTDAYITNPEDMKFFYYTIQAIEYLDELPIYELRDSDIIMLQRISAAANCEGLMLLLSVDFYDKNLVVGTYHPDRQSNCMLPFHDAPDSTVYISNDADPAQVVKILQEMSNRYDLLDAPPFQKYADDTNDVPMDQYILGNAKAKYAHEIFMRDHGMHNTVIPNDYKKPAKL